jgi:hypothetical protein
VLGLPLAWLQTATCSRNPPLLLLLLSAAACQPIHHWVLLLLLLLLLLLQGPLGCQPRSLVCRQQWWQQHWRRGTWVTPLRLRSTCCTLAST